MKYWQILYVSGDDVSTKDKSLPDKFFDQHLAIKACNSLNKMSCFEQYKVIEVEP